MNVGVNESKKQRLTLSDDFLSVLLGENCSSETLPISVRSALLVVYLILLQTLSGDVRPKMLSSAVKLIRSV